MQSFGEYLKKIRESKDMTVNQLAMYSGVSAAAISRIENGKRGVPKPETIKKLSDALKAPYEELMKVAGYLDEEPTNEQPSTTTTVNVAGKDISVTTEELRFLEELKKHPLMFHGLQQNPEEMVKDLVKSVEFRKKFKQLIEEDDDRDDIIED